MKIRYLYLFILFLLFSCREELFIDDIDNEELLVVDGFIANTPRPYTIKLSKSSLTSEPRTIPFTGCIVIIKDDNGNSETLSESQPGVYTSSITGIQGVVGNKYQLSIKTSEGKEYTSNIQEIKEPIGIDSVYAELEYIQNVDFPKVLPGYQFYLDTKAAATKENYFLWTMSETYEYDIDYVLKYLETRFGDVIYSNPRYDTLRTCWKTNDVNYFFTAKTTNLDVASIHNKPLHFVDTYSKKLTKRYSLIVNQFIINEQAYNYWRNIESQISDDDFLSTTQPYNIMGNIKSGNNSKEKVLGYFTVASISSKRIFVDKPKAPFYYPTCLVITDSRSIYEYKRTHSSPYFYVEAEQGVFGIISKRCIDCRSNGGSLNQPSFWISK